MKNLHWFITIGILSIAALSLYASNFQAGKEKNIDQPVNDNLYVAAESVTVNAPVYGDLIAAGQLISVHDTVFEDLTVAGQEILINAFVGDDARIAGQNIQILDHVQGDLIVFGSSVQISSDVVVEGDLIVAASYVAINGTVNGRIKAYGERIVFNGYAKDEFEIKANELNIAGTIDKKAVMAAKEIKLDRSAQFNNGIEYWNEGGELDFSGYAVTGPVTYNEELKPSGGEINWKHLGMGIFKFWIFYTLSVLLTIFLLTYFIRKPFARAGEQMNTAAVKNFGYGMLYFIGLLVLALLSFLIIIGIPVGIVILQVLAVSLLFANSITSVILAHWMNIRYNKSWSIWKIMLAAALIFPVLKLISVIPAAGLLIVVIIIGMAFGALMTPLFNRVRGIADNGHQTEEGVS